MQIKVEAGRGYLPGNLRVVPEESKGIGKIILDASFSPVSASRIPWNRRGSSSAPISTSSSSTSKPTE